MNVTLTKETISSAIRYLQMWERVKLSQKFMLIKWIEQLK